MNKIFFEGGLHFLTEEVPSDTTHYSFRHLFRVSDNCSVLELTFWKETDGILELWETIHGKWEPVDVEKYVGYTLKPIHKGEVDGDDA